MSESKTSVIPLVIAFIFALYIFGSCDKTESVVQDLQHEETQMADAVNTEKAEKELEAQNYIIDAKGESATMYMSGRPLEKNWESSSIGRWACGVVKRNGAPQRQVRFVDSTKLFNKSYFNSDTHLATHYCD